MVHIKMHLMCLMIVAYIGFLYLWERHRYHSSKISPYFAAILVSGALSIVFDGTTAYTVNHLETVPLGLNFFLHACFYVSLDMLVYMLFLYLLNQSDWQPDSRWKQAGLLLPLLINLAVMALTMPSLEFCIGVRTNYSMGIPVYTCFVIALIYVGMSVFLVLGRLRYVALQKRINILTCVGAMLAVTAVEYLNPVALVTCMVPVFTVLASYLNQENPAYTELENYHREMVMGFGTLIENRDDSTGGHIHRTTAYVELLANELRRRGNFRDVLTRDYIQTLVQAAPMHDIGKIAIPDAILQKPGRLTPEEFGIMKTHAERGARMIADSFGQMGDEQFEEIACQVARFHHEKWNGKGYPQGLSQLNIPLSARIMAVADVFDAVSAKRCYRDALPLDACFDIIRQGSGRDFDPVIVQTFLELRPQVERLYAEGKEGAYVPHS